MSQIKKDGKLSTYVQGRESINPKAHEDFNSESDYFKPVKGQKFKLGAAMVRKNSNGKGFLLFEVYIKKGQNFTEFAGYITFRRLQGLRFDGIKVSKAGNDYSAFELMNTSFCVEDKKRFGTDTASEKFPNMVLECTDVLIQSIPAYVEGEAPSMENMVEDTYYLLKK